MADEVAVRIVFMGTPEFAVPVLGGLRSAGYEVAGVYTRPDRPAGRGQRLAPPPVKAYAQRHGLRVFQPGGLGRPGVVEELAALEPQAMVVAAYGRILPPPVLRVPPKGVLNIHPSLLPRHRGPSPVATAILEGDAIVGVTVMLMDEGMDTGPILAQRVSQPLPDEMAGALTERLFVLGTELLLDVLPRWIRGEIAPLPQDHNKATVTRMITKEDGEMDWAFSAVDLERRLRAFNPWPGCYTRWQGKLVKVLEGVGVKARLSRKVAPGTVVQLEGDDEAGVAVATGDGLVGLVKVQLEGGRPQTVKEFVRGHPSFLGATLPS